MKILETIFDRFEDPDSLLDFLKYVQSRLAPGQATVLDRRILEATGEVAITLCTSNSVIMQTLGATGKVTRVQVLTTEEFVSHLEATTQSLERNGE